MNNVIPIIGIAGGSSSGKTYLSNKLMKIFNDNKILSIEVDSYYKNLAHLSFEQREKNNFDNPASFEFDLLFKQLNGLRENKSINLPLYDYKTHTRKKKNKTINTQYNIILVEGILSLYKKEIRDMMDLSIFIDIPNNIRKKRRCKRDLEKRERTMESIIHQYNLHVEPMYKKYIEPTKKYADIIIKNIEETDIGYIKLIKKIKLIINNE